MAVRLEPSGNFNFREPDSWPRWKARFEQFRIASGLSTGTSTRQVSTLLYCIGEVAELVLSSTDIAEEERENYEEAVGVNLTPTSM